MRKVRVYRVVGPEYEHAAQRARALSRDHSANTARLSCMLSILFFGKRWHTTGTLFPTPIIVSLPKGDQNEPTVLFEAENCSRDFFVSVFTLSASIFAASGSAVCKTGPRGRNQEGVSTL